MKTIYTTNEWKVGKHHYCHHKYRLEGDTVTKYKCHRFKYFDGDENVWETDETELESWNIDDPGMPEWLKDHL